MKKIIFIIFLVLLLVGCGTSEGAVQTAIAETAAAMPTDTDTPVPTETSTVTPSPTSTLTPTPTSTPTETSTLTQTATETPLPLGAFGETFEEMRLNFMDWIDVKSSDFEYEYDLMGTDVYHAIGYDYGVHAYLMDMDGVAAGFMFTVVVSSSYDSDEQVDIVVDIFRHYLGKDGLDWLTEHIPENPGDKYSTVIKTDTGVIGISFANDDENKFVLTMLDKEMLTE